MTRRILHFLNLDAVGGVEHLFHNFIAASHPEFPQTDHALVTGGEIHPHFSSKLHGSLASVHYLKSWHGMKLPKRPRLVRRSWQDHVVRKVAPGLGVLWNRFGDAAAVASLRKSHAAVTYYEHGSAWLVSTGNGSNDFANSVDSVICASFAARRVYELRWGFRAKISVVLNCLRPDMEPAHPMVRSLPADRPVRLGIAARLVPLKGVVVALHAMRELLAKKYHVELHIAGTGPLQSKLTQEAAALGISSSVVFHGCVQDMAGFYANIDLLIVPSVREPFGMVIVEAAAHGCPAVAAKVDGIPEALADGRTGLCVAADVELQSDRSFGANPVDFPEVIYNPDRDRLEPPKFLDPKRLAEAIASLLDNPAKYQDFSSAAINHARNNFSAEAYSRQLRQAFADAMAVAA